MRRITEFQISCRRDGLPYSEANLKVGYLAEVVTLSLSRQALFGSFRKLVLELQDGSSRVSAAHSIVGVVYVQSIKSDLSGLLALPEPELRRIVLGYLKAASEATLEPADFAGLQEVEELCRRLWLQGPPYEWKLGRGAVRYGPWRCQPVYVFGPELSKVELRLDAVGKDSRVLQVKAMDGFWPVDLMFPARRLVPRGPGLAFLDRFGREIAFTLVPG